VNPAVGVFLCKRKTLPPNLTTRVGRRFVNGSPAPGIAEIAIAAMHVSFMISAGRMSSVFSVGGA